jgi:3-deoxy-D-manno-octulosonate 8-phosphate phosphatase (KDO 8-P phosphatase)
VGKNDTVFVPQAFVVDVDGVLTDGQFHYTIEGKVAKVFGPEDHYALSLLKNDLTIHFISADTSGFDITKKRVVDHMHFPLDLVSAFDRVRWIEEKYGLNNSIYMGDGIFDPIVFTNVGYSIAPANAFSQTKKYADFVTETRGGEGAVAEACLHIMEKFFKPFDPLQVNLGKTGEETR